LKSKTKKSKSSSKTNAALEVEPKVKLKKTFDLRLTKTELLHLRDMMSILFPSVGDKTVSQCLAETEKRTFEEASLWKKISEACVDADLPVGDDAPDYAVVPIGHAPMGVFMLDQDDLLEEQPKGFLKQESEEEKKDSED